MALLNGIFNAGMNPDQLNMRSFAASILRLFPGGAAPIFALSSQSGKSEAKQATHGYFSKTMSFITMTLGGGVLIGDTTATIPSTAGITTKMVFHNLRTRENIRVTAVNSLTSVSFTRSYGRIAAAAMNTGDILIQIGTSFEEGSVRPTARGLSTVYVANFTQIFRNAWGLTDTARASMVEKGFGNVAENRSDNALFHSSDIEAALIWGQAEMDTTGATPVHATQGIRDSIVQYASTNITTAGATTSMTQLETMLTPLFKYSTDIGNPTQRVAFCDNKALQVMNQIGRASGQVFLNNEQTTFGMKFTTFVFYLGTLTLVNHPLLNGLGSYSGLTDKTAVGTMIVMDMPALKLAYMQGRDTKAEEYGSAGNLVELGTDGIGGSLTTEFAVELINPASCGMVEGLVAGVAG